MHFSHLSSILLSFVAVSYGTPLPRSASSVAPYSELPATPTLPTAITSGYLTTTGGADIWYATFGRSLNDSLADDSVPVLFLHGGMANSNYFGDQVESLLDINTTIITMDSRGHGRSTTSDWDLTYDKMESDVISVLDQLSIPKVSIVGWSDGGIIGLDLAMNATSRVDRLFAYGASYDPSNMLSTAEDSTTWNEYLDRVEGEYDTLNPDANFTKFYNMVNTMWTYLPVWTETSFSKIPTPYYEGSGPLIWISDGAQEEIINTTTPRQMHEWIDDSGLLVLPRASHFGFLQDPTTFNSAIRSFFDA